MAATVVGSILARQANSKRKTVADLHTSVLGGQPKLQLRHHREGEIVAVTAGVAGLEVVAVDRHDGAIGQVAEGAADGIS